ncbi:MAG: hypothetical protein LBE48_05200 [Methanomassiliicoccaceae archaeon]|jgi:hypothetical protein|nr:hypothetical protein [Methanomassiliicoccaceae archaeon]
MHRSPNEDPENDLGRWMTELKVRGIELDLWEFSIDQIINECRSKDIDLSEDEILEILEKDRLRGGLTRLYEGYYRCE